MPTDPRIEILPKFHIRSVSPGTETTLVTGTFSRVEGIAIDQRGWLFVSDSESSIADIVTLEGKIAGLDVPNWSVTVLLDRTRTWQRVEYNATDAVVFAKRVLRCQQCGWAGDVGADLRACLKCSSDIKEVEIFGNQEAVFPLATHVRFVETRSGFWDHDHCLICGVAIGRNAPWDTGSPLSPVAPTR